jgi:hypothetical protein
VRFGFVDGKAEQLNIAEIEVYDENGSKIPVSTVTASSQYGSYGAKNVVDGNVRNFGHTQSDPNAFFELDLNAVKKISKVVVYNRTDCCQDRAKDAVLTIKDGDKKEIIVTGKVGKAASRYVYNPPTASSSPSYEN